MDLLRFFVKFYGVQKNYGLPIWFFSPIRRITRAIANKSLPKYLSKNKVRTYDNRCVYEKLIVSLTSFPKRINNVWQVIECIKRQTVLPSKIILWLSEEQFPNKILPSELENEVDELFEIRFVKEDIRSHKKYYYVAKEYPDYLIFLIDDDIYYSPSLLERIIAAYKETPNCIISNYGFLIKYGQNGKHLPYSSWHVNYKEMVSEDLFFGSGGGTLIQPNKMHSDLVKIELAQELSPLADDVWLNTMTKLSNMKVHMIQNGVFLPITTPSDEKLTTINDGQNMNDKQINAICNYYLHKEVIELFCKNKSLY